MKPTLPLRALIIALGVAASGAAAAQSTTDSDRVAAASPSTATTSRDSTARLAAGDRRFVAAATEAGIAEVEMAKVARERAASEAVRQFAAHMIEDHQKAGDQLAQIAGTKGLAPTAELSAKDQAELRKLQSLSGPAFDQEYVRIQLAAHKQAVQLFQGEARGATDPDLKAFAASTLPTLREHLAKVSALTTATPAAHAMAEPR